MNNFGFGESYYSFFVLLAVGLAPFIAIMTTSFVKLVVVLSLVRNALGTQQVPPNLVINGLAILLSVFIMAPVAQSSFDILKNEKFDLKDFRSFSTALTKAKEPICTFLYKHTTSRERLFFISAAKKIWPPERSATLTDKDILVLIPAFTVDELTAAFKIGFLIFLPFLVIDLVVSNILLAMGMMMVSPMMISMPLKILLFVLADGWPRLIHGLVLTY